MRANIIPITLADFENLAYANQSPVTTEAVKSEKSKLLEELEKIDKKYDLPDKTTGSIYDVEYPTTLGMTKKEYTGLSDAEIYEEATKLLSKSYFDRLQNLESELAGEKKTLSEKKEGVKNALSETLNNIEKTYAARREEAENNALKRGLARSSVIMGQIDAFDREKTDASIAYTSKAANEIAALNSEIASLEQKKQNAMKGYELAYAVELQERINEMTTERQKREDEVLEYNNQLAEKESKFQFERENALADKAAEDYKRLEESNDLGIENRAQKEMLTEKVAAAKAYYETMSPKEAYAAFLGDSEMVKHLGVYYDYFLNYLKSRL